MHLRIVALLALMSFCAVAVCAPEPAPDAAEAAPEKAPTAAAHLKHGQEMFYRGVHAEYAEMVAQAQVEFEAAIKLEPLNVDAHRGLQDCRKYLGDQAENVKAYEAMWRADPGKPEYVYLYTRTLDDLQKRYDLLAAALPKHKDSYWLHYGLAVAKYKAGNNASCVNSLEECIRIAPDRDEPYKLLFNLYLIRAQSDEKSLEVCKRAIAKAAAPAFAHANMASILQEQDGKLGEAIEHYKKAVALDPQYVPYRTQIAAALIAAGRKDEAAEYLRPAIEFGAGSEGIDEAEKIAKDVFGIKWKIDNAQRRDFRAAEYYLRKGAYDDALACAADLLYNDKTVAIFYVCKARALLGLKRDDEAVKALDAAEKLEPKCAEIYEVRADMAMKANDNVRARTLLQKSLSLNPYSERAYLLLAAINHAEEKYAAAVDNIARYYALTWDRAESRLFLIDEARAPRGPVVHEQQVCGFALKFYLSAVPTGDYTFIRWIIHAEKNGKVIHTMFAEEVRTIDKQERKILKHYYLCDILDTTNDVRRVDMGEEPPTAQAWREAAAKRIEELHGD